MQKGILKWFDENKNYGFIETQDGQEIFVHKRNIPNFKFVNLLEGDEVTFDTFDSKKGIQAKNVKKLCHIKRKATRIAQFFEDCMAANMPIVLKTVGQKTAYGIITDIDPYKIKFQIDKSNVIEVCKIDVKYLFKKDEQTDISRAIEIDRAIKDKNLKISSKVAERFQISNIKLDDYLLQQIFLECTLVEGEKIRGFILWFSKYEIAIKTTRGAMTIIFRHAIVDLKPTERIQSDQELLLKNKRFDSREQYGQPEKLSTPKFVTTGARRVIRKSTK